MSLREQEMKFFERLDVVSSAEIVCLKLRKMGTWKMYANERREPLWQCETLVEKLF